MRSALCRSSSMRSSCSRAASRSATMLLFLASSAAGGRDSQPGEMGGDSDGAGDRASGERRGTSASGAMLANNEWK